MRKINWKKIFSVVIGFLWLGLLFYTRLINLNWGLPYPMHPDERNIAESVTGLSCLTEGIFLKIKDCFNPHFFAYGQLSLYLSYGMSLFLKFFNGNLSSPISFIEAVFSLRLISALASIINFFVILKIISLLNKLSFNDYLLIAPLLIFSPFFIQFSHFGTTESLLMLFYSLIFYFSLVLIEEKNGKKFSRLIFILSLISGLSSATKISSIIFWVPVFLVIIYAAKIKFRKKYKKIFSHCLLFCVSTVFFTIIFSPHNLISFTDFMASLNYESAVATGKIKAFYTKQFDQSIPIIFQLVKIFPFALGYPVFFLGIFGLLFLNWRDEKVNLLRFFFIIYFLPAAFLYAKWTRFMAPIFPLILILAILIIFKIKTAVLKNKKRIFFVPIFIFGYLFLLLQGIAFLTIFTNEDVRFVASKWIYKNLPTNSFILSETANVIDIPVKPPNYSSAPKSYRYISFNFYNLDEDLSLQLSLNHYLSQADFIIIPSRRVFLNYYCPVKENNWLIEILSGYFPGRCKKVRQEYPLVNRYYDQLFAEKLGFKKLVEFRHFPKISFFGKTLFEFNDELAEETHTVFDHPVIRIFKRI